jgi:hypothetical protein
MKKFILFFLSFIIVFVIVGCGNSEATTFNTVSSTETTTDLSTTDIQISITTSTIQTTITPIPTTTISITEAQTTAEFISLKAQELPIHSSYYGNTNGNANNQGLVVYDTVNKLHYFALGPTVYSYNPATDQTTVLFTLSDGGYVRNLCLTSTHIYFVSTQNMWMMRYNFSTEEVSVINQLETHYISRYDDYIYVDVVDPDYYGSEVRGFKIYKHNTESFLTNFSSGVSNLNISGTKLLYLQDFGSRIQLMSSTFIGKTTEANFDDQGFNEIIEMHMIKDSYTDGRTYAFVANTTTESVLYLYNATTGLERILGGSNIHSLNSDNSNLYFIHAGAIYSYNLTNKETSKIIDVYSNSKYIFVINYWLYYSNSDLSALYRINPDTQEVESLS